MKVLAVAIAGGTLLACAVASTSAPEVVPEARSVTPAMVPPLAPSTASTPVAPEPTPVAPEPPPVAPVPPSGPESEQARQLAEVSVLEPAARWAWASSVVPELAEHSEVDPALAAWGELRRRGASVRTLWVRTRGDRCFSARGEWEEQRFVGRARTSTRISGATRTVQYESIEIDAYTITVSGPHGDMYTRDERGRWQESGGFGVGSMAVLADRPLSKFRRGAAYYGGQVYTLTVECAGRITYEERCTDGATRRCGRCGGLVVRVHAAGMQAQGAGVGWGRSVQPRDCSEPCPPDVHTPRIPALNLVLDGRRFHAAERPVAAVYTSRQACQDDSGLRGASGRAGGRSAPL